ncbi:MAG: hypothetical protein K2L13_01685 [Opitutales bacterium]|nr:hypothetical protein [Opitutales bacterium]
MRTENGEFSNISEIRDTSLLESTSEITNSNGDISVSLEQPKIASKPLFKRILHIVSSTFSGLGLFALAISTVFSLCAFFGAAFCPPLIVAIIGIVGAGMSLLGTILNVTDRATDKINYDNKRNVALGMQLFGKLGGTIALSISEFVPVVGQIAIFIKILNMIGSAFSSLGFVAQVHNDYRNKRILSEYGDNLLGRGIQKSLDTILGNRSNPL